MRTLKSLTAVICVVLAPVAALAEERPLALVEHVAAAPDAGIQMFDYVYKNDKIDLRPNGELRIAYFNNCQVETISGGLVKLRDDGAKVTKGGASTIAARPCQTASLSLDKAAREAGVAVKRVTPFPEEEWREVSVAAAKPRFIWPRLEHDGEASVTIFYLDAEPAETVWQASVTDHYITYPDDAPVLQPGMPYEVVISYDGKRHVSGVFSIDPALDLPISALTTTVPLGL